jgi:spermidine/putrescine transport system ATP-binding protein
VGEPILRLAGVSKVFGALRAVDAVDLDVRDGEFLTVVGPSGSGKTTLLRMLAGLESPTAGDILLRGRRINDLPPNRRPTCLVFQSLALFPHRSVGQNIEFPLKMRGVDPGERRRRAQELMATVRLPPDYYGKNVQKCSGGERQRVALARALAYDPEILFFDEPLSAIDYKLRKTLEKELKDLHKETGKTFVYITHSLEEAMVMSDRIGVMRAGRLVQVGTPEDIYARPKDLFVSAFMGEVNLIPVRRNGNGTWEGLDLPAHFRAEVGGEAGQGHLVVRPEQVRFLRDRSEADNSVEGRLYNEYSLGSRLQYQVRVGEKVLMVERSRRDAFAGDPERPILVGWDVRDQLFIAE